MIKTSNIELSKGQYFKILAKIRFGQSWLVYLLPFIAAPILYFIMPESDWIVKFLLVYGVINPIWILIYLTIHINSRKAEGITIKRFYEIDNEKIIANLRDGTIDEFYIENIREVKEFKNELLLYFSKSEFIFMPKSAFSNDDLANFISILRAESKIY